MTLLGLNYYHFSWFVIFGQFNARTMVIVDNMMFRLQIDAIQISLGKFNGCFSDGISRTLTQKSRVMNTSTAFLTFANSHPI